MDLTFRKEGLITVGSYDDTYSINLQDPFGKPIELNFNLETETLTMAILSWDDRNSVVRQYNFNLPTQAWFVLLQGIFEPYVREISKNNYPEFSGLTQMYNSITINGVTYPVSGSTNENN